ncbi:MAG TPA: hypothetical protein VN706_16595 [Gemmatimonadaceae bacterium]|nr:hypothetical protein [Gemmatimonadaceae bacterium]
MSTMTIYDTIGTGYTARRRADPRFAALIRTAIGDTGATGVAGWPSAGVWCGPAWWG